LFMIASIEVSVVFIFAKMSVILVWTWPRFFSIFFNRVSVLSSPLRYGSRVFWRTK
jgi:hypothetical protein